MKSCELSIPGKTFVAGEYVALSGGPALLLTTEPKFKLVVSEKPQNVSQNLFHPQSPSGRFLEFHKEFFSRYDLKFIDPYQTGGFGASSAQFALLHTFLHLNQMAFSEGEKFFDWHQLVRDYRDFSSQDGRSPSGADIVGAASGGLTWFHRNQGHLQTFAWPFDDLQFFLCLTGNKLATHEHLKTLDYSDFLGLEKLMPPILQALQMIDSALFIDSLIQWKKALLDHQLCAPLTLDLLGRIEKMSEVKLAKGCGAMGADVILVICHGEHSQVVSDGLKKLNLSIVADSSQVATGLQIKSRERELGLL